jgi:polysaccharide export outer membrane protein
MRHPTDYIQKARRPERQKADLSALRLSDLCSMLYALGSMLFVTFVLCGLSFSADNSEAVSEYTIGPEDVIQVSVWQYDQFNTTATVGPDGKITMHLLGDIPIAGLTREEAKKDIAKKLSEFIKEGAEVTVGIVQFNSQKISVFGAVANPTTITFSSPPSLLEVIMTRSIPTPDADLTAVKIIPADSSIREPIMVNMADVLQKGDTSQLPKLHPGDTVYVPRSKMIATEEVAEDRTQVTPGASSQPPGVVTQEGQFVVHVMGAVGRPSTVVSTEEPTLTQALLQAGSVTDSVALKDIRVIRGGSTEGDRVIHVDLDKYLVEGDASLLPRLHSGDTIYVPDVTQEAMRDIAIIITGEVVRPGSYQTREPLDILDAISMAGGLTPNADPERIKIRREDADSYQEKIVNIDESLEGVESTSPPEMVEPGYRIYVPARRGSAAAVGLAARTAVAFLADLIPIYGLWRLVSD